MKWKMVWIWVGAWALMVVGCGDDETPPAQENNQEAEEIEDLIDVELRQLSVDGVGQQRPGASTHPAISAEGDYVVYATRGTWLEGSDNGLLDVVGRSVSDVEDQALISVDEDGQAAVEGGQGSSQPAVDGDGEKVVFSSTAYLNIEDPISQIYRYHRGEGSTEIVSVDDQGLVARAPTAAPTISDDGHIVAFESGWDLVGDGADHGLRTQIYVYDERDEEMRRASNNLEDGAAMEGEAPVIQSRRPQISGDGRVVVFESNATDLVDEAMSGRDQVYRYEVDSGELQWISRPQQGSGDGHSRRAATNEDGSVIALISEVNLVDPEASGSYHLFPTLYVYDVDGDRWERPTDGGGIERYGRSAVSADGRFVALEGEIGGINHIFWHDRHRERSLKLSQTAEGEAADGHNRRPSMSADGRRVVWESEATNLVEGGSMEQADIVMADVTWDDE